MLDFTDFFVRLVYNRCKENAFPDSFSLQIILKNIPIRGLKAMYKPLDKLQRTFLDFNQPLGMHMNPKNRWIDLADRIPWNVFEAKYADLFPSDTGNVAKPLRMALGSLIIQKKFSFSDRELVAQITENPYLQYFIGLPGYQEDPPFDASTLVLFRKRLTKEIIMEANDYILDHHDDNHTPPSSGSGDPNASDASQEEAINQGTLIVDATCAPANIRFPQDVSLLNESREKLETIIGGFCKTYSLPLPRRYGRKARKEYLAFAKSRKHSQKQIRKAIKRQLSYVRRDLGYLDYYMHNGYAPVGKEIPLLLTIMKLYEQQLYMYESKTHTVSNRIVSISQPWLRPIVRGKAKAPVEFGAKLDLSIDEDGYARIEHISFEAYNESTCLQNAITRYYKRTGRYPERELVDQIYRTRENRNFCNVHGIRISGPKLGRPSQTKQAKADKKQEYQDNSDRIEVEREFSVEKHSYGLGLVTTRLEGTQLTSIALSVFVANLFKMQRKILCALLQHWGFCPESSGWMTAIAA